MSPLQDANIVGGIQKLDLLLSGINLASMTPATKSDGKKKEKMAPAQDNSKDKAKAVQGSALTYNWTANGPISRTPMAQHMRGMHDAEIPDVDKGRFNSVSNQYQQLFSNYRMYDGHPLAAPDNSVYLLDAAAAYIEDSRSPLHSMGELAYRYPGMWLLNGTRVASARPMGIGAVYLPTNKVLSRGDRLLRGEQLKPNGVKWANPMWFKKDPVKKAVCKLPDSL